MNLERRLLPNILIITYFLFGPIPILNPMQQTRFDEEKRIPDQLNTWNYQKKIDLIFNSLQQSNGFLSFDKNSHVN